MNYWPGFASYPPQLTTMADGTIKQVNPFSGTEVWTVPGRANRPLNTGATEPVALDGTGINEAGQETYCAFCAGRVLQTPPEKTRIVGGSLSSSLTAEQVVGGAWDFRRVPNLFEIVTWDYWSKNYGYELSDTVRERMNIYLSTEAGREHVEKIVTTKLGADASEQAREEAALGFFGGGHELIIGGRHYVDGATDSSQLASAGSLSPEQHFDFWTITVEAMRDIYAQNRYARYVQVFQNWLKPAGASFEHLHKQLVAIDQHPVSAVREEPMLRANPNLYNEAAVDYAGYQNLVIAENEHAVMLAGVGHRYPTLEVWSRSAATQPWEHSAEELRDMSDLVHAMHAATGAEVPANEEWYAQPRDSDVPMPWRVLLKWRVSTLAGFEGGTKIYVNTIDPWSLRDRVVPALQTLRGEGKIASDIAIATECTCEVNSLKYNRAVR